jgi:hypothetical protein
MTTRMTTSHKQCESRSARADSAAGDAPILRGAGNGATSKFHKRDVGGSEPKSLATDVNDRRRKRLNAGKFRSLRLIDLLSARCLLYKSPRETEVERC